MRNGLEFRNLSTSNLSHNYEKELTIKDFGGVDYSNSTLFVDVSRAVSMSNFIKEDGINQKRKGFREIYQFAPIYRNENETINVDYKKINGVWELTTSQFNEVEKDYDRTKHLIVQANNKFYEVFKQHTENNTIITEHGITTDANKYTSQYIIITQEIPFKDGLDYSSLVDSDVKSYGVIEDERLYILTGKAYLMIGMFNGAFEVRKVEDDEFTYIPTTSISVPPIEYNKYITNAENVLQSSSLEEVNMLSRYRINKLLGLDLETLEAHATNHQINIEGLIKDENGSYEGLDPSKYLDSTTVETDKDMIFTYQLDAIPFELDYVGTTEDSVINAISNIVVNANGTIYTPYGKVEVNGEVEKVNSTADFYTEAEGVYTKKDKLLYCVDYEIDNVIDGIPYGKCYLVFNYNVIPNIDFYPITVKYSRYIGLAKKINKCRFGCMFGYSETNRLFVSGNEEYPNVDYHTIDANVVDGTPSLTYFGEMSYTKVGTVVNSINGYAILGDGKMAIFKTLEGQTPTIFFRTAETLSENITDINGNSYVKLTEIYPIQEGTIGEGNLGHNTIQNLNGDTLMLSNNGVFGIELDSNVASSQRWAKRRSRLIDPVLKGYDLSKAVCTTFNDRLLICLEDGKVFVADARYPIKLNDDINGLFQYEWWEWNGINARLFFSLDNKLWFGTNDGMLCCFEDIDYKDTTTLDINSAGICYVYEQDKDYNDKFVVSPEYMSSLEEMTKTTEFHVEDDLYALAFETNNDNVSFEGNKIIYDYSNVEGDLEHFIQFMLAIPNYEIRFDRLGTNTNLSLSQGYKFISVLHDVDSKKFYYDLSDSIEGSTNPIYLDNEEKVFRVCLKLSKGIQTLCNVGTYLDDEFYLLENFREYGGKYYFVNEEGLTIKETEFRPKFNYFSIRDYTKIGKSLKILNFNEEIPVIDEAKLFFNRNISCHYYTPPFDMNTRYYNKDLHKLIIVPDNLLGTSVDFGFKTSNYEKEYNAFTGETFDFDKLDFDTINFLTEIFAKVYVKQARKKRWSYIQFFFKNDVDGNCKINNLTVIYTIGTKNKGVR